jgi:hypothetical protein
MAGAASGGMCAALEALGLIDSFDVIYGSSSGSMNASYTAAGQAARCTPSPRSTGLSITAGWCDERHRSGPSRSRPRSSTPTASAPGSGRHTELRLTATSMSDKRRHMG